MSEPATPVKVEMTATPAENAIAKRLQRAMERLADLGVECTDPSELVVRTADEFLLLCEYRSQRKQMALEEAKKKLGGPQDKSTPPTYKA